MTYVATYDDKPYVYGQGETRESALANLVQGLSDELGISEERIDREMDETKVRVTFDIQ